MFTLNHFIWIALCVVFCAGMLAFAKKTNLSLRNAGYIMTVICVFSEISKMMTSMIASSAGGMVLNPRALPFHLCSLMLFGVLYITFAKDGKAKQVIMDFMAPMGTLGSICAILIPTNGVDFATIKAYQCFVYHGGLLWFSLYLIMQKHANLCLKTLLRNVGLLLALVLATLYVNSFLSAYGTNFMYLVRPPMQNLPILNLDSGWHIYFLRVLGLGAALVTLFHLPFIIRERREKREK